MKEAVAAALARIESHPKKRHLLHRRRVLTHLMAEECVRTVGLDSFGPGRKVDILLKERSGEFGNVWESCLLVKALAKRQCKLIHFEQVVSVAAAPFAPAVRRVLAFVLADWKPAVEITVVTVHADEALAARAAAAYDDAWFDARSASTRRTRATRRPRRPCAWKGRRTLARARPRTTRRRLTTTSSGRET